MHQWPSDTICHCLLLPYFHSISHRKHRNPYSHFGWHADLYVPCVCFAYATDKFNDGVDEYELQVNPDVNFDLPATVQRAKVVLQKRGLLLSAIPKVDNVVNDYDPSWMLGAHPSAFPHNTGARPKGMSEERWAQCIIQRYPTTQFSRNLGLIAGTCMLSVVNLLIACSRPVVVAPECLACISYKHATA